MVTMAGRTRIGISTGASFSDLQFKAFNEFKAGHYSTLNISELQWVDTKFS